MTGTPTNGPLTPASELRRGWTLIFSAGVGVMCSVIVLPYYSIGALVVPVTEAFGWSRAQFQAAIFFSASLGALTAPVVGWLCDRFGSRRIALPSLVGLALGLLAATLADGRLWVLYLAYASMAILGAGTIPVSWTRVIATSFFRQRGLALGLMLSGTGVCGILIPIYTTWLVQQWGWQVAYIGLALLPLLIALPITAVGFKPLAPAASDLQPLSQTGLSLREAASQYRFWLLLASIFLVYMAVSGIVPNLYPAITDAGRSAADAALAQSAFGAAVIVGRIAVGYFVDRFWAPGVAAVFLSFPVLGCWLLIEPGDFATIVLATCLLGIAAGAELDLMAFFTARYFGLKHYAQIYSVLYMALAVCSGTAPMLFAALFDRTASYAVSFGIAMLLFAGGALLVLGLGRYPRAYAPDADHPNAA